MSVVKVEICSRIPSRSASAVVRSARVCFRRREARRIDDVAAAEIESEIHRPSGARPGLRRADPHGLPVDDEPCVDRSLTPLRQERLDRLGDPVRVERDAEAGAVRTEADELRQALRRERADVLVLEGERDRLGDELLRLGERLLGRARRSARARRASAPARSAGARRVRTADLSARGAGRVDPARRVGTAQIPPRRDDLRAAGLRQLALESRRRRGRSAPGRGTSTGSTSRAGGDGSTSARTRRRNES